MTNPTLSHQFRSYCLACRMIVTGCRDFSHASRLNAVRLLCDETRSRWHVPDSLVLVLVNTKFKQSQQRGNTLARVAWCQKNSDYQSSAAITYQGLYQRCLLLLSNSLQAVVRVRLTPSVSMRQPAHQASLLRVSCTCCVLGNVLSQLSRI